ncbi:MAG: carboxylesterase family protein [Ferruginibacter sp.]
MKIKTHSCLRLLVTTFLLLALTITSSDAQIKALVVNTHAGLVSGTINKDGDIHIFKGIPFAAPPVGDLRWKAPQPLPGWSSVKKCSTFSASPMQGLPTPFMMWSKEYLIPAEPISEDCLYLNIWTGSTSTKKPVLVWIYGGGFTSGGSAAPIYDGEAMAKKGIVFVSINYRVGIFGFFAHPDLTKESPDHASGNYGLLDQVAALTWVKQNIAAFGGDTNNVTIAGQSAGSMSVNCLVASPLAKGLFNKAIAESGASFLNGNLGNTTLKMAEQEGVKTASSIHANSIKDLRKLPAADLMKAQSMSRPVIDGYVLPQSIAEIFASKKENKVALLTGWNEDEGFVFGPPKNAEEFKKQMAQQYGSDLETYLKYYPATNDSVAALSQTYLSRDMIFGVQNYTWANVASGQGSKVYVYRFTRKLPAANDSRKFGAFHTGEVPYAYDNLKFVNRPWEKTDHDLAQAMSAFWINFIKKGDPNGDHLPGWKPYNTKDKEIMMLGEKQYLQPMKDFERLDFISVKMKSK